MKSVVILISSIRPFFLTELDKVADWVESPTGLANFDCGYLGGVDAE